MHTELRHQTGLRHMQKTPLKDGELIVSTTQHQDSGELIAITNLGRLLRISYRPYEPHRGFDKETYIVRPAPVQYIAS